MDSDIKQLETWVFTQPWSEGLREVSACGFPSWCCGLEKGQTDCGLAGAVQAGQKGRSCPMGMGLRADTKVSVFSLVWMPLCESGLDWSPCLSGRGSWLIYSGKSGVK